MEYDDGTCGRKLMDIWAQNVAHHQRTDKPMAHAYLKELEETYIWISWKASFIVHLQMEKEKFFFYLN